MNIENILSSHKTASDFERAEWESKYAKYVKLLHDEIIKKSPDDDMVKKYGRAAKRCIDKIKGAEIRSINTVEAVKRVCLD